MKTKEELFGELARLCAQYNAPDFHIFLNFDGHVDRADLKVYIGGWEYGKEPDLELGMYVTGIDNHYSEADIRQAILELVRLHRIYKKASIQKRKKSKLKTKSKGNESKNEREV